MKMIVDIVADSHI